MLKDHKSRLRLEIHLAPYLFFLDMDWHGRSKIKCTVIIPHDESEVISKYEPLKHLMQLKFFCSWTSTSNQLHATKRHASM